VVERLITVTAQAGLHARPAAEFVRLASEYAGSVRVQTVDRGPIDGASILGIMTLGVERGESIVVSVDGPDAEAVLDRLARILDPA